MVEVSFYSVPVHFLSLHLRTCSQSPSDLKLRKRGWHHNTYTFDYFVIWIKQKKHLVRWILIWKPNCIITHILQIVSKLIRYGEYWYGNQIGLSYNFSFIIGNWIEMEWNILCEWYSFKLWEVTMITDWFSYLNVK